MYKGSTDKTKCVSMWKGMGVGAAPQAPPLDFFSSTLPPSSKDQPWQL